MESSRCRNRSKLGIVDVLFAIRGGAKEELVKKNWLVVSKYFLFLYLFGEDFHFD